MRVGFLERSPGSRVEKGLYLWRARPKCDASQETVAVIQVRNGQCVK